MNNGGPAFPLQHEKLFIKDHMVQNEVVEGAKGMSLRDYFAAHAMQGLLAGNAQDEMMEGLDGLSPKAVLVAHAYEFADAMLEEKEACE